MGRRARGSGRIRTRIVTAAAVLVTSGCSLLFGLDDHNANPGSEGGVDTGVPSPDGSKPGDDSGGSRDGGIDAPVPACARGAANIVRVHPTDGGSYSSARGKRGSATSAYISGASHIFDGTRGSQDTPFNVGVQTVGPFQSTGSQQHGSATADDTKMLYVQIPDSRIPQIWGALRNDGGVFQNYYTYSELNGSSSVSNTEVYASPDGSTLYFASNREGTFRLYESRSTGVGTYGAARQISGLDSFPGELRAPVVSDDGKLIFFSRKDNDGLRIYSAVRPTADAAFGDARPVCYLAVPGEDQYPTWISPDNGTLLYIRLIRGNYELWQARPLL